MFRLTNTLQTRKSRLILAAQLRFFSTGPFQFKLADRVNEQLQDPRLGELAGKLDATLLNAYANNPYARHYRDARSGHINVIQQVGATLLRITVLSHGDKIISVGPVRGKDVVNAEKSARFVPLFKL